MSAITDELLLPVCEEQEEFQGDYEEYEEEPEIYYEKNCLEGLKDQTDCISVIMQFICPFNCATRLALVCKEWLLMIKQLECKIELKSSYRSQVQYHKFYKSKFFNNVMELSMQGTDSGIVNKTINCSKNSKLKKLQVYNARPKSAFFIAKSGNVSGLTSLKFADSRILNIGAIRIIESEKFSNLKELYLPRCKVDANFARHLANTPHMSNLTELNLDGNNLRAEGVKYLASSPFLSNLTCLNLKRNRVEKEGASYLATSQYLTQLTNLNLDGNSIGDEGLSCICSNMLNLTHLNLSGNLITDEGIKILSNSPNMKKLQVLYLLNNNGNKNFRIRPILNTYSASSSSIISNSPYLKNLVQLEHNFCDEEE
ncbi:predicted protein [Naegleria gruberi]|uniref:Predicted protein n=1 Tax=Naegleria gruberi TaxID=5762 RepID=D2V4L5_NAEGR|nr:uncharacterized protein NAEGRDRAFT_46690 [Naegleria gruberi]EFC48120.1 predicted protein [Naegleria gruberi]|eukprot:XP_002680864.1 predicted protein [Naegleria gruberi strain NEG-M]